MTYINESKSYRRVLVKKLFDQDKTDAEIAHLSDYSESWIKQLRKQYQLGIDCITTLHKPGGSVCRLTAENLARLAEVLTNGAESYGLEGAFWDRKRIKYVIEQEFSVIYDVEHISDIVAKIKFTLQKPEKKDFRQNAQKVETWEQITLPDIKKSSVRP